MKTYHLLVLLFIGTFLLSKCKNVSNKETHGTTIQDNPDTSSYEIKLIDLSVKDSFLENNINHAISAEISKLNKSEKSAYIILSTEILLPDNKNTNKSDKANTVSTKTILTDYAKNYYRVLFGTLDTSMHNLIIDSTTMTLDVPIPEDDEFNAALTILQSNDKSVALGLREEQLEAYMPMPLWIFRLTTGLY